MDLKAHKETSVRGGRGSFDWENVKNDKYRTNYLGHSLMAPVGRGSKDPTWYSKDKDSSGGEKSEIERVKELEKQAMAEVLGYNLDEPEEKERPREHSHRRRSKERHGHRHRHHSDHESRRHRESRDRDREVRDRDREVRDRDREVRDRDREGRDRYRESRDRHRESRRREKD